MSHLTHISGLIFTIVSKQEDGNWNKQHISNTPQNKRHCSEHATKQKPTSTLLTKLIITIVSKPISVLVGRTARSNICPLSKVTLPTSSSACYTAAVLSKFHRCKSTKENALFTIVLVSQAKQNPKSILFVSVFAFWRWLTFICGHKIIPLHQSTDSPMVPS